MKPTTKRQDVLKLAGLLYMQRGSELAAEQCNQLMNGGSMLRIDLYPPSQLQLDHIEKAFIEIEHAMAKKITHEAIAMINPVVDELGERNNYKPSKEQRAAQKLLMAVTEKIRSLHDPSCEPF